MTRRTWINYVGMGTVMALLLSVPAAAQDAKPYVGTWKGAISVPGMEIEVIVKFNLNDDQSLAGTIDVPQQGAAGLALGNILIEGKSISFTIDDPNVPGDPTFKGKLDESGKKIAGDYSQAGQPATFSLEKQE